MNELEQQLFDALVRMFEMHKLMMEKVNHGASFYDAETIREINEAPIQASEAIMKASLAELEVHLCAIPNDSTSSPT